jgi:mono/diheme cytochrome c family protein
MSTQASSPMPIIQPIMAPIPDIMESMVVRSGRCWIVPLAFVALAACNKPGTPGEDPRADPRDAAKVALGAKVYAQHCASCHGANLEGQHEWRRRLPNGRMPAPPHDESGHTWHHPDDVLFDITQRGMVPPYAPAGYESDMPAFADRLSDDEIWAVLAYIKSHWHSREVLETRAEMLRNARSR